MDEDARVLYYVRHGLGCSLYQGRSPASAEKQAREEFGTTNGPYYARQATSEDIGWVKAMGGYVPE